MNMFEEIEKAKKDLPKFDSITDEAKKQEYNGYQKFAIITFIVCFCLGIVFGNAFPACGSSSTIYSTCVSTEFNFSLMLFFWFASFLVCLFFFALGHIIKLLTVISENLTKSK